MLIQLEKKELRLLYNNLRKVDARHDYYYKRLARQLKDTAMNSFPGVDKRPCWCKKLIRYGQYIARKQ